MVWFIRGSDWLVGILRLFELSARGYLTHIMNQVFQLIPLFTGDSDGRKTKKANHC
jgi:hypothetical protein